jgi:ribosomal protein S18 acetylase RimI-like enzyme
LTLTIRTATVQDAEAVLGLWLESEAEPTHTDDAVSLGKLIEHDPGALLVAVIDGRVVGSVIAGWDGWRGSLYRLVVSPTSRRQGLGRRLLIEGEHRLKELGAIRLQAIVVGSDARAAPFWRVSGWDRQADRLRYVKG